MKRKETLQEAHLRPGSLAAIALYKSVDIGNWKYALKEYQNAISLIACQKKKPELLALDIWLWKSFVSDVKSRIPEHFTLVELSSVMKWKLIRGKFRPLQALVDSNSNISVINASTNALLSIKKNNWKDALKELCVLKGIGVATASTILACFIPEQCAFMADEVIETCVPKRDYTLPIYIEMIEKLTIKCVQLNNIINNTYVIIENKAIDQNGNTKANDTVAPLTLFTVEDIGKALWSAAVLFVHSKDDLYIPLVDKNEGEMGISMEIIDVNSKTKDHETTLILNPKQKQSRKS